ncbi:hypothetical protein PV04_07128 [Phialophora macrospora]|uniref:Uncharacterized protein n=1 Tax=Phialophora macrospora TaxID=1851006 RepID=A0A0D2G7L2_9EURO|nr:hypothetical protein PV04_07128 [Phialophora macrospora]
MARQHQPGKMDHDNIKADITATDGTPDLMLDPQIPSLRTIPSQSSIQTNNATKKIDGEWYQVAVRTNPLLGSTLSPAQERQALRSAGPLSDLLNKLGVSTILRMDILKDAQMVLNMPTPLRALSDAKL